MPTIPKYKTFSDYNESGVNQILYPVRDAIPIMNPFFVILMGFFLVAFVGSYFTEITVIGKSRFFNSFLAASLAAFVVSIFFAMMELVSALVPLTFIGMTILALALVIFYK